MSTGDECVEVMVMKRQLWHPAAGIPGDLPLCLQSRPQLPRPSSQGAKAGFFRVLPVTIFVAALVIPFQMSPSFTLSTGATKKVARSLAQLAPAAGNEVAPGDAATEAQAPEKPPPSHTTGITAALATDPITFSQPEIEALAARREQIEQQIQRRFAELLEQQKTSQDKNMQRLVKVYENMKPKTTARIFDKMGKRILLRVAARMKEAKLAPILAQMDPVSAELVRRHELPRPPGPVLEFAELLVEAQNVDR